MNWICGNRRRTGSGPITTRLVTAGCLCILAVLAGWLGLSRHLRGFPEATATAATIAGADNEASLVLSPATSTDQTLAETAAGATKRLDEYSAPGRSAQMSPPVADRIELDPSLAETPSLPVFSRSATPPTSERSVETQGSTNGATVTEPQVPLERQSVRSRADIVTSWPLPRQLIRSLNSVNEIPVSEMAPSQMAPAATWAAEVQRHIEQLHSIDSLADQRARDELKQLETLAMEATGLARDIESLQDKAQLLRAGHALSRHLAVWKPVHMLAAPMMTQVSLRDTDQPTIQHELQAVEQLVGALENGSLWRDYLLLDRVQEVVRHDRPVSAEQRSQLARKVLGRMYSSSFTSEQLTFFDNIVWKDFTRQLRRWVSEPVSYRQLLNDVEQLELGGGETTARQVATQYQILRWSPIAGAVELSEQLNTHYRNANVRTAISGEFLNRLIPKFDPVEEEVNDVLLGGRVFGRSLTSTRLSVVLFPDRLRWRLGLEAEGQVDSQTHTKRGPARFHNTGRARFLARKILLIDRSGVDSQEAEAHATSAANLAKLETEFDGLPLVNILARAIARQQYDSKSGAAGGEIRGMVASRARSQLDEEVERQLKTATEQFRKTVHRPLERLGLQPEAVDMQTTRERLIARYRLAGDLQMGAFTPRPQAPSDSLISVQIHQSAVNNLLEAFQLHGHKTDLRTLFDEIADKLQRERVQIPDDVPDDVTIQFAKREPVRLRWEDDRIHITLRVARLSSGRRHRWRNLEVRATYGFASDGLHVRPVADGRIRLKGYRLSFGDQVVLRGIFSKVFPQHPDVDLLGNRLVDDPRLRSLLVTQFVIRDGWIGMAIGAGNPVRAHLADEGNRLRG